MKKSSKRSAKKSKQARKVSRHELDKRLIAYSVAFGAALVATESAQGEIRHRDLNQIMDQDSQTFDLQFEDTGDVEFTFHRSITPYYKVFGMHPYDFVYPNGEWCRSSEHGASFVAPLNANITIDNDISYYGYLQSGNNPFVVAGFNSSESDWNMGGLWQGVNNRYIGLRFEGTDGIHYGWVKMSVADFDGNYVATIYDCAYETTPDTPILAGAVPEPCLNSLGMLALGAFGVLEWKRRRNKGRIDV